MGPCRRSLTDDDVQLVVLERGVELLFEYRLQAVDLVQKEDLTFAQVGQDGGQVALDLQRRAGGLLEADVQLVGDDGRQRRLAQARAARRAARGLAPRHGTWPLLAQCPAAPSPCLADELR